MPKPVATDVPINIILRLLATDAAKQHGASKIHISNSYSRGVLDKIILN